MLSAARRVTRRSKASPALVEPLITSWPRFQPHGHGLARQRRLVQHRPVAFDRAVDGRHVALPDQKQVVRRDLVQRHLVQRAVVVPGRRPGHPGQKVAHLAPGAALGKALEKGAARIHQRDHRRRERLAKEKRRRHGQGRHDVEPDLSLREAPDDLDQQRSKNRNDARRPCNGRKIRFARHPEPETRHQAEERNDQQRDLQAVLKQWVHRVHPGVRPHARGLNGSRRAVQPAFREAGRLPGQ